MSFACGIDVMEMKGEVPHLRGGVKRDVIGNEQGGGDRLVVTYLMLSLSVNHRRADGSSGLRRIRSRSLSIKK
jgi:hypothetical protein